MRALTSLEAAQVAGGDCTEVALSPSLWTSTHVSGSVYNFEPTQTIHMYYGGGYEMTLAYQSSDERVDVLGDGIPDIYQELYVNNESDYKVWVGDSCS